MRDVINPLVSLLYLGNQRQPPSLRPLPRLSLPTRTAADDQRSATEPSFHLIDLSLSDVIVANIAIDNATIITIQINQATFDMVGDGM